MKLLLIALIFPATLIAGEIQEPTFSDYEAAILERLSILEQQRRDHPVPERLPPIVKHDLGKLSKIQAALGRNSILEDENGKRFYIKNPLFVHGLTSENNPYIFFVLDHDGLIKYTTEMKNVVDIKRAMALNPAPTHFEEAKVTENANTESKELNVEFIPFYELSQFKFNSLQGFMGEDYGDTSIGHRLGLEVNFPTKYFISPALTTSFNFGSGKHNGLEHNHHFLDLGFKANMKFLKNFKFGIGAGRTVYFKTEGKTVYGDDITGKFDGYFGALDLSYERKTWVFGTSFKAYRLNASSSLESSDTSTLHDFNFTLGISIGKTFGVKF